MTTHATDADSFLMGAGGRSAQFKSHGDQVFGTVMSAEMRQQVDLDTNQLAFWDDGNPKMQLVVTLLTEQHEDDDDDGLRKVYIKGQMQKAVADAVRKAGVKGIREGGRLVVRYVGDAEPIKKGFSGAKQFIAKYEAPTQEVMVPEPEFDDNGDELPF